MFLGEPILARLDIDGYIFISNKLFFFFFLQKNVIYASFAQVLVSRSSEINIGFRRQTGDMPSIRVSTVE